MHDGHHVATGKISILIGGYLLLLWFSASSFIQFDPVVVLEANFPGESAQWIIKGDENNTLVDFKKIAVIPKSNTPTFLSKTYELERGNPSNRYISVMGDIISQRINRGVSAGDAALGSQASLFYVWFGDENRASISIRAISNLAPENQNLKTTKVLSVPYDAHYVNVSLLLRDYQAKHALIELEVEQIERTMAYKLILLILVLVPLAGLLVVATKIRFQASRISVVLIVFLVFALVVGVVLPGNGQRWFIDFILQLVPRAVNVVPRHNVISTQDALHFLGFFTLTLVVLANSRKIKLRMVEIIWAITLFAIFTEVIQRHSVERSPNIADIAIDLAGLTVGALVWFLIRFLFPRYEVT